MKYDVVVVGGGHAGAEAASAAARLGRRTALVTLSVESIARLPCNPAVGGLGKGHLVRELDALGGFMARAADAACTQFRRLNTRKGLAVQASRAIVDIDVYPRIVQQHLRALRNLDIVEGEASEIRVAGGKVVGVEMESGWSLETSAVILTTGTFLSAVMHCGEHASQGGRSGEGSAQRLAASLDGLGLRLGRLKTGTVPRLDARTVTWRDLERQSDTIPDGRFSFGRIERKAYPVDCYMAYTNPAVHDIIRANLDRSPMFTGAISGHGPRYCPSVEDKVVRFADKDRHLLFLEPEGNNTHRVYVAGLSTSLPAEVQDDAIRNIVGLQNARIESYGYAVEYAFVDPRSLGHDLQHREVEGLYFAGQVNGTSGYEEAAVQGFVAGVSAAQREVFHVKRTEGYIGVLVDDLVTRGVGGEPYRMFTSRAEHRLLLREDNADRRLMSTGRRLGLIDDETWHAFQQRADAIESGREHLAEQTVKPTAKLVKSLDQAGIGPLRAPTTAEALLRRPKVDWAMLAEIFELPAVSRDVAEQIEVDVKYEGYIARAERQAEDDRKLEGVAFPPDVDWRTFDWLSMEVRERLDESRPPTLADAARLPGVTPAAVNAIAVWLARSGTTQAVPKGQA